MNPPIKALSRPAKPRPPLSPLPLRLAERRVAHQRLSCVRPAIRMRVPLIVFLHEPPQPLRELLGRCKIAPLEKTPLQHTEPQLYLVEPRAMLGREHEAMGIIGVAQELTP